MLNDNGNAGNAMGDIRNLYKSNQQRGKFGMKQSFLPTTVAETPASTISMEDATDAAIVKLMMSYKGYTGDDVVQQLTGRVSDLDAIKPTMFMLDMSGWFDKKTLAGEPVYTLRRNKSLADLAVIASKTQVRKFKAPEVAVIDPAGQVKVSEGVDIGIWKVMSDRKWRSLREVISILKEFGLDRNMVDTRLTSMVRSNRWFDRQGTGGNTFYRLKTHIECPVPEQQKEMLKANFEPERAPRALSASDIVVSNPQSLHDIVRGTENSWTIPPETDHVHEQAPVAVKVQEDVKPGDTLHESIWKVMVDREEYTVAELVLLLADYGFTAANISPAMSVFFQNGWVDRREGKHEGQRAHYVYRLKEIQKPEFKKGARTQLAISPVTKVASDATLKDAVEQFNQAPMQEAATPAAPVAEAVTTNQSVSNKEHEVMSKAATAPLLQVVPQTPAAAAPLLACVVSMKGVEISIIEFGQLYKELRASGFHAGRTQKASLIQANSYNIKGVQFTTDELDELVGKMNEMGIAFQKAVTL